MKTEHSLYRYLVMALVLLAMAACSPAGDLSGSGGLTEQAPTGGTGASQEQSMEAAATATAVFAACMQSTPAPLGQSIAETYEMPHNQILAWFCDGYSYENIMIALETSEATEIPADTLLQMLLEKDWEEIWVEIGFTNK